MKVMSWALYIVVNVQTMYISFFLSTQNPKTQHQKLIKK